jgi:hypothetical protein
LHDPRLFNLPQDVRFHFIQIHHLALLPTLHFLGCTFNHRLQHVLGIFQFNGEWCQRGLRDLELLLCLNRVLNVVRNLLDFKLVLLLCLLNLNHLIVHSSVQHMDKSLLLLNLPQRALLSIVEVLNLRVLLVISVFQLDHLPFQLHDFNYLVVSVRVRAVELLL